MASKQTKSRAQRKQPDAASDAPATPRSPAKRLAAARVVPPGRRVLSLTDLAILGITFSMVHLQRLEREGRFPKRAYLGPNTAVWPADEIHRWIDEQLANRGKRPARSRS